MTVAELPEPGREKPILERFEVSDRPLTAQLTDEQKKWRVMTLRSRSDRFEVMSSRPTLTLKLHLAGSLTDTDRSALESAVLGVVEAMSEAERALGGGGLMLAAQRAEPNTVILTLAHAVGDGAAERAEKLAALLNDKSATANDVPIRKMQEAGSLIGMTRWEVDRAA
jgi:hypothetical protein